MTEPLIFDDLHGPTRTPTAEEADWLSAIAAETDPSELTVSLGRSAAAADPGPVLQPQLDGSWRAGRYIGEIRRGEFTLQIRPRLGLDTIAAWASAVLNVRVIPEAAEPSGVSALIAELVAAVWRAALVDAARDGLPGFRARRRHIGVQARGQLDLNATIRLRAVRRPLLASISRERDYDNAVSRSIVLADLRLDQRLRRQGWRGERVEEVMPRLRGATSERPPLPTRRELESVRYTPITEPYRRVAELSWQIARNRGLLTSATADTSAGLLIDVAELWELFLVHCARRALGAAVVRHATHLQTAQALLASINNPQRTLGRLYPDLLIEADGVPRAIIDAKYKRLQDPRGVDREDLYQLNAYLTAHRTPPTPLIGALAYPSFPAEKISQAEDLSPWRTWLGDEVRFARLPIREAECVPAMHRLVGG